MYTESCIPVKYHMLYLNRIKTNWSARKVVNFTASNVHSIN